MSKNLIHDDAFWRAESDARTLAEAGAIQMDKGRLAAARKAAARQYKAAMESASNLKNIAANGGRITRKKGK